MTDLDIPRLAALAEAATPGPWEMDDAEIFAANGRCIGSTALWDDAPNADQSIADAAYIAAADPTTILALIRRVQAAEAELVAAHRLVKDAYNEGFSEGMREHSTSRGGKPWVDSNARKKIDALTAHDAGEGARNEGDRT